MTPQRQLVIIEHHTLNITLNLGQALHNTQQSMNDGYPTRSPGNGNPGGGSITATSTPPPGINTDAPIHQIITDPARLAHNNLHTLTTQSAQQASQAIQQITGRPPITPASRPIPQAVHAHRIARLLALTNPDTLPDLTDWLNTTHRLRALTLRWAWTTHTPARTDELLATDLTGNWCRRHLTHGYRTPRHRGDLCRWCYTHQAENGELPTDQMIDAHEAGNYRRLAALINARKTELAVPRKRHR